jgi:hypothetical protein
MRPNKRLQPSPAGFSYGCAVLDTKRGRIKRDRCLAAILWAAARVAVRAHSSLSVVLLLLLLLGCSRDQESANPTIKTERVVLHVNGATLAGDDSFAVIEPVWWTANIYDSLEDYETSLSPFSQSQRLLFALHWYISEVNNGGHEQFYFNSTGITWPDALEAFRLIDVPEGAEILQESASRIGGSPPRERDARQRQIEEHSPDFEDLDNRFYELQERIDLNAKMLDFARAHADAFYFDGPVEKPVPLGGGEAK